MLFKTLSSVAKASSFLQFSIDFAVVGIFSSYSCAIDPTKLATTVTHTQRTRHIDHVTQYVCLLQYMHSNTLESKPLFWENYTKGTLFGHHKRTNSRSTTSNLFIETPKHYNATLTNTYFICELIKWIYSMLLVSKKITQPISDQVAATIAVCLS